MPGPGRGALDRTSEERDATQPQARDQTEPSSPGTTGEVTSWEPDQPADLGVLTGVRSGKRSFYREYVRSTERLTSAVQALDGISRALVRNVEGPRALVR